jgi:hypothetical protein
VKKENQKKAFSERNEATICRQSDNASAPKRTNRNILIFGSTALSLYFY